MTFFCAHQQNAGTISDQVIETQKPCCSRSPGLSQSVGEVSHDPITVEAELDRVIAELGDRMMEAMRTGDKTGAAIYLDRMTAAMASRSPEHQQRLHAKAWQRMLDEDACYFSACGELDAERGGNV
jgi:hypothetical protein